MESSICEKYYQIMDGILICEKTIKGIIFNNSLEKQHKCGENRNHGKFKIYFLIVEL